MLAILSARHHRKSLGTASDTRSWVTRSKQCRVRFPDTEIQVLTEMDSDVQIGPRAKRAYQLSWSTLGGIDES